MGVFSKVERFREVGEAANVNNGEIIAVIAQKLFSVHDKYCIDIYKPEHEKIVIAILITLQHMIKDRENAAASSSASSN